MLQLVGPLPKSSGSLRSLDWLDDHDPGRYTVEWLDTLTEGRALCLIA